MSGLLYFQIVVGLVLAHLLSPFHIPLLDQFILTPLAHLVARVLIALQLGTLFIRNTFHPTANNRPPLWLAGMGAMCLPFALNIRVYPSHQRTLLWGLLAFVVVTMLFNSEWRTQVTASRSNSRWTRVVLLVMTLSASLLLGGGSALALQRYERSIEWFLGDYLGYRPPSARSGFTDSGRLSDIASWKLTDADEIALRANSSRAPGYLRGTVFDTYHTPDRDHSWSVWTRNPQTHPLVRADSTRGLPGIGRDKLVYSFTGPSDGILSTIDVWLEGAQTRYYFAPLETASVVVDQGAISRDLHGALRSEDRPHPSTYSLLTTDSPPRQPLDEHLHQLTTALGPDVSPSVIQLADELFADCQSTRDKIDRVQEWFSDNFEYGLGIDIPTGTDPLTHFLNHRPPAHCEYFATGSAVLLRLAGVPSRYVTGYFCNEKNDIGGYWTARNKDAHAWVEAYDEARQQWVIVESTPAAGIPQQRAAPWTSQGIDAIRHFWGRLQDLVHKYGIGGALLQLGNRIWSIPGLVLLMSGLIAPVLWRKRRLPHWNTRREEPRLKAFHSVLAQLDRHTLRQGIQRRNEESLIQFATRIRQSEVDAAWRAYIADCYVLYARLRFQRQQDPDAVELLQDALSRVPDVPQ